MIQDIYVIFILFYLVLVTAKASIMVFVARLAVAKRHVIVIQILTAVVIAWGVAGIFGSAFECPLPSPWITGDQCINRVGATRMVL